MQRVLELTLLHLKPGVDPTDPGLLKSLCQIRNDLQTKSRFFVADRFWDVDPKKEPQSIQLFILGSWPTLRDHELFLANDRYRDVILRPQEKYTEFQWVSLMGGWCISIQGVNT
jgi:hypothetical protein